jgi:hypothetical protein
MGIFGKKSNDRSSRNDDRGEKNMDDKTDYTPPTMPSQMVESEHIRPILVVEIDRDRPPSSETKDGRNRAKSTLKNVRNASIVSEDWHCVNKVPIDTMTPPMTGDNVVVKDKTSRPSVSENDVYSLVSDKYINILEGGLEMMSFEVINNNTKKDRPIISDEKEHGTTTLKYRQCPDDEQHVLSMMDHNTIQDTINDPHTKNPIPRASIVFENTKNTTTMTDETRTKLMVDTEKGPYCMCLAAVLVASATIICTLFTLIFMDQFHWNLSDWINSFYCVALCLLILILEVPGLVNGDFAQFLLRLRNHVVEHMSLLKFLWGRGGMVIVAGTMNLSMSNASATFYTGLSLVGVGVVTVLAGTYACHRLDVFENSIASNDSSMRDPFGAADDGTGTTSPADNRWIDRVSFARWVENTRFQLDSGSSRVGEALRGMNSDRKEQIDTKSFRRWWGDAKEKTNDASNRVREACCGDGMTNSVTTAGIRESVIQTNDAVGNPKYSKDELHVVV